MVEIGDLVEIPEEGIEGCVAALIPDEDGEPEAALVVLGNGRYAAIPLCLLEEHEVTLH